MGSVTETVQTMPAAANETLQHVTQNEVPLKYSGSLDKYEHFDVTPVIGREYPTIILKELLEAPDSDALLRDLAITSTFSLLLSRHSN